MRYLVSFAFLFFLQSICLSEKCEILLGTKGTLSDSITSPSDVTTKCYVIEVPRDSYLKLKVDRLRLERLNCLQAYLRVNVLGKNLTYYELEYCDNVQIGMEPVISFGDVTITFHTADDYTPSNDYYYPTSYDQTSFKISYSTESLICVQKEHFRCSPNECVHPDKLCDGVKDCKNGTDEARCGIAGVEGIDESRLKAMTWLLKKRTSSFGWSKDTHRAVTALFLAKFANLTDEDLEKELVVKHLELQLSAALLRNSTDPMSVNDLAMFVNALRVTCHNPRNFLGHNLLQILGERASVSEPPSPIAYLSLCNSNWKFSESDIERVFKSLQPPSNYPISLDVQALAFMAISCMRKDHRLASPGRKSMYEEIKQKFVAAQLSDGSFGNIYTTALVTQALISSGKDASDKWKIRATAHYLMSHLYSRSVDFLSVYLTLPIFKGLSLVDISNVNCSNIGHGHGNDISDVTSKMGNKMRIQYSLFIGNKRDVIHTIVLRMPENSTAYDTMRVAQVEDPKYKFHHQDISSRMYVYEVAGITNDPEAGKFWLLYLVDPVENGTLKFYKESPAELVLGDEDHLVMWYKTPEIQ